MKVLAPASLDAALAARGAGPVVPMAGGTDLLVHWPVRLEAHDETYLDLGGIDGLGGTTWTDAALELGAGATYWDVVTDPVARAELPLLVDAGRLVGAVQIQTRGTWAGNIANGSPAADGVPVLMGYDAEVVVASTRGRRAIPLDRFYSGYKEMDLGDDELIVSIRVPRRRHAFQRFVKVGTRRAQAIAKVGLAVALSDAGWRVVAASVAPTVTRLRALEARLDEGGLPDEAEIEALAAEDVAPIDDLRSTAAYRSRVLARALRRAVLDAGGADG